MVSRQPPAEQQRWTADELADLRRRARARRRVLGLADKAADPAAHARLAAEGGSELVEVVGPEAAGVPAPTEEPVAVEIPEPRLPS
ncbi:hypothetical protein GCM10023215_26580 [Pseudonocardia yuanmonensis]|uniref:Uncharacterized protein n=1 Tax=Pseudonocardia yuanmonensis TaxID=1095914 RepID=A0ABP8WG00_9PSEU